MRKRLPSLDSEWIDRSSTVSFQFEGRTINGYEGDTITAALLASGEGVLGRSFKYHRPRSSVSLANHDINVLVQTEDRTNIRADVEVITNGGSYRPVNVFFTLKHDLVGFMQRLKKFLPVGFYYKTFYRPKVLFPFWERLIRALAGLGAVNLAARPDRLLTTHAHTDVLVVGGGATGMAAALSAAQNGAQVVLAEENPHLGGSLHYQNFSDRDTRRDLAKLVEAVISNPSIKVMIGAEACGYYCDAFVPLVSARGVCKVRAKAVVFATGVFEQLGVFGNNDTPGVMLVSGAQRLIARYAVKPFERAVLLVANDDGYTAALDFARVGIDVVALVDMRPGPTDPSLLKELNNLDVSVYFGAAIYEVTHRDAHVVSVEICPISDVGKLDRGRATVLAADGVAVGVGYVPAGNLLYQAGAKFEYDENLQQLVPTKIPTGLFAAGRLTGVYEASKKVLDGKGAGVQAAAHALGKSIEDARRPARSDVPYSHPYPIFEHREGWNFVDLDEDLTLADLRGAIDQGFDNIELLKRFSTIGMGPSQGKLSNMLAIRILAEARGLNIDSVGSTTARPLFHPVPIKALSGKRFRPSRKSPLHEFHAQLGAHFLEHERWHQPAFFGDAADETQCVVAEVSAIRSTAGMFDLSSLEKIEVFGPDAADLLDRSLSASIYDLAPGELRYSLILDTLGVVISDALVSHLLKGRYYLTAAPGAFDKLFDELQRRTVAWNLDVDVVNLTDHLGAIYLAGPYAEQLLAPLISIPVDNSNCPRRSVRECLVKGEPAFLLCSDFIGERCFELHMGHRALNVFAQSIFFAGGGDKLRPVGLMAQEVLRLESGSFIVGRDTDGMTNPFEMNIDNLVFEREAEYIGKRSLKILRQRVTRQLIGFSTVVDGSATKIDAANLVISAGEIKGRITRVAKSPTLDRIIGYAFVDSDVLDCGDTFMVRTSCGESVTLTRSSLPFYTSCDQEVSIAGCLSTVATGGGAV